MTRSATVLALTTLACSCLLAQPVKLPRAAAPLALVDFGDPGAVARWSGLKCSPAQLLGAPAMSFTMPRWQQGQEEWPAVYLDCDGGRGFATQDWSHHAKVVFDAQVSGERPGDLALELRDTKGRNGWAQHFEVAPGKANHFEVSLGDIAREVRLDHLEQIVLFASRPDHEYTVTVANLRLEPGQKEPLAEFDLAYPNYRGLVFPEADRVRVTAELQPEEYDVRPGDLTLKLTWRGEGAALFAKGSFLGTRGAVALRTARLPAGPAELLAELLGPAGKPLASREWPVRKLTPGEARGLKVYLDPHNNCIVDGKPFFPLGFYGGGSESQALEVADSPYNCLLDYGTNHKSKAEMRKYLDLLHSKGLRLIYCLNDVYPTARYLEGQSWEGIKGNQAIADGVVRAYRDHPALLAWYLNDELPRTLEPKLRSYYRRVAELDPNHPCYIVLCNMAELRYFPETTDVMGVDPYPIPSSPVTTVSDWMESANRATRGHMPTWLVPQAFAWYQHHPEGSDRARIPNEEDLRTGRAPTFEEARCMTYLALAHGAKGLIYWCYYNMRVLPQYKEMWGWMKRLGGEVKALSPVLLSPEAPAPARFSPRNAPIHTRLLRHQGRQYLIAVNAGSQACAVAFDLHRALPAQVEVLFEGCKVPTEGAKLPAAFKPLEVHVYDLGVCRWGPEHRLDVNILGLKIVDL